jgi:hypothetical protein
VNSNLGIDLLIDILKVVKMVKKMVKKHFWYRRGGFRATRKPPSVCYCLVVRNRDIITNNLSHFSILKYMLNVLLAGAF